MNRADLPNPFDSDVVVNPSQPSAVDVRSIHSKAFELCCAEFERVRKGGSSRSVLFNGQAGCGKTHLLSRLRRWLFGEIEPRPGALPAAFVAVRMETAPSHVWRHLRRRFAEQILSLSSDGTTVLDGILNRFAKLHGHGDLSTALEVRDIPDMTLDMTRVVLRFTEGSHRRLCRAWLKGETLSEFDRNTLEISGEEETLDEHSSESIARQFVLSFTRLCEPEPVVFCFDQLEALKLSASAAGAAPYTRMAASLVDETTNSLVISSALATYLKDLRDSSMLPDYQRMSKVIVDLHPIDWPLGRQLVEARLESVAELKPYRGSGGIEPLLEADLSVVFTQEQNGRCAARRLIHEAKRLFAAWQGAEIRHSTVEQFLENSLEELREKSAIRSEPARLDEILAHGLSRSAKVAGLRVVESKKQEIDFEAGPEKAPILLALCNEQLAKSVYHKLGRLRKAVGDQNVNRLCLIRDPRLPIAGTAKRTHERLAALTDQGARFVRPDLEAVAAVDAIRLLISQAISEDLSHEGETVSDERVLAWLDRNLPSAVTGFLDEVSGENEASGPGPFPDLLLELLRIRKVVSLDEAAHELGCLPEQVVEYARSNPSQTGLVEGRTPVVFHVLYAATGGSNARP
jgi:DNA polymerase III delta prime subunit